MSPVERARVAAFVVFGTIIAFGPTYGQFFAHGRLEHLGWRMYRVRALDFCGVDYRRHFADGHEEPLDHAAVLGFPPGSDVPFEIWRIDTPDRARAYGRQMCARLGAEADVRARIRFATVDGWTEIDDGTHDLCAPQGAR